MVWSAAASAGKPAGPAARTAVRRLQPRASCPHCKRCRQERLGPFKLRPEEPEASLVRWLIPVAMAALLAGLWWRRRRSVDRQRRLMLLCSRVGLEFAALDLSPDTAWLPFPMFGHPRRGTENVVWDRGGGEDVRAFDFWYRDTGDESALGPRRRHTCAVVPLEFTGPRLRVAPRDVVDDIAGALGEREIRLELEEFDRRFRVETEDARFAVAFLDQRMMEALLGLPENVTVDVNEDVLLLWAPQLPPEHVLLLFNAAVAIRRRIPRVAASLFPPPPTRGPREHRWLQGRWSPESTGEE